MRMRRKPGVSDYVTIGVVICGHVMLLLLFARLRQQERDVDESGPRATLVLIDSMPKAPRGSVAEPDITRAITFNLPPPRIDAPPPQELPSAETRSPAIDWRIEGERSARNAIREQSGPQPRGFEPREPPPKPPKARDFRWDPSPGRFGFAGGLPYMEIGKRCVIGLGFFGCAIGELPPPKGDLFDGMDDPNRERSSVPGVER